MRGLENVRLRVLKHLEPIKRRMEKKSPFFHKIIQGLENVRLKVSKHLETVEQRFGIDG